MSRQPSDPYKPPPEVAAALDQLRIAMDQRAEPPRLVKRDRLDDILDDVLRHAPVSTTGTRSDPTPSERPPANRPHTDPSTRIAPDHPTIAAILDSLKGEASATNDRHQRAAAQADAAQRQAARHSERATPRAPQIVRRQPGAGLSIVTLMILLSILLLSLALLGAFLLRGSAT